jgi:glycosyltransferase involved in cell wall biosynthesis
MKDDLLATGRRQSFDEKIAIFSVGELFGGVERHILGLAQGLKDYGIQCLLILFHDGELAAQARGKGVELLILPSENYSLVTTSRSLADILKKRRIRIVHVHGYKAMVCCALTRFWYRFGLVKTEHGLPEPMAGRPLRVLRDRFYHLLDARATRITTAAVCYVTEELRAHHARAHAGLRTTVIPNGVPNMERKHFERPPEFGENWFNVVVIGRLDTVKGHHVAIEALSFSGIPADIHLLFVGNGPSEIPLRALAHQRGLTDRVHFLGFRRNVYDYVAHSDVLLIPSLHEGLPYILLEAMALSTSIIASRVGGLLAVLEHGITGLLIPVANPLALSCAIAEVHDHVELRRRYGENAQLVQRAKYSLDAMASRYLEVYRTVLLMVR